MLKAKLLLDKQAVWCDISETAVIRMSYPGHILDVNHRNILGVGIVKVKICETHLFIETTKDKQRKTKDQKLKFFVRSGMTICSKLNTNLTSPVVSRKSCF